MRAFRLFLVLAILCTAHGYITSYMPQHKQIAWLKKMTVDICETSPGALTNEMLETTTLIMSGWKSTCTRNGKESALALESLLKRVIDERRAGNPQAIATTSDYNCMLEGWASSGAGVAAAERCERILVEMQDQYQKDGDAHVQPNLDSFKAVLLAWRQQAGQEDYAPHRAQRILEWMVRLYKDGQNDLVVPDTACFEIVLQSWSRSNHKDAPQYTEALLVSMERLYKATGLETLRPSTACYNAVLSAWAKSSKEGAPDRAMSVLEFMESCAGVEPDMVSYSTVVGALARTNDPEDARKAEKLLKHVEVGYRAGNTNLEVDTILYNCVIGCLAKSNANGSYRRARAVLDRQIQLNENGCEQCRPDVYSFTSVIGACAMETKERSKAFRVAVATFQQLRHNEEYATPNHVTYGSMLKCCARLLPSADPLRRKWVRKIFNMAVNNGCVGDMVLSRLREAATPDVYKELMNGVDRHDLPYEWTRNVQEKRVARKKRRRAEV
jgi:hypothetical protein